MDLLREQSSEGGWFEFKQNWWDPKKIGRYVSALSNSAALAGRGFGYLVWGVHDEDHQLVGTSLRITAKKVGNEPAEPYLKRMIWPEVGLRLAEIEHRGHHLSVLQVAAATGTPTAFESRRFFRVGSVNKDLAGYPQTESRLWSLLQLTPIEKRPAAEEASASDVLDLLDDAAFLRMENRKRPSTTDGLLELLADKKMIRGTDSGRWDVLNLGALLFARRLDAFDHLLSRELRVIEYDGDSKVEAKPEVARPAGYAVDFEGTVDGILSLLPASERIGKAHRVSDRMYPEAAIRELYANMLIHQELSLTGLRPRVEIFRNRIEFTNAGPPAVETHRLLDKANSRNELLAKTMQRYSLCEERGSGIDRVVGLTEFHQLPPPDFVGSTNSTVAILHAHRSFGDMTPEEKLRACYLHVVLRYLQKTPAANETLRERFGLSEQSRSAMSRLLREAKDAGQIKEDSARVGRYVTYVPAWA